MSQTIKREESARRHLLVPAANMETLGSESLPHLDHAEGIYFFDETGRRLIDGPAGMWCAQVGYKRKEMADAISAQIMTLPYNSPWYTANTPSIELAARIAAMTPGDLNRIFFTTGGSTAVDTALRFSEYRNNVLGRPNKKKIIVRKDGYHGSTDLTAACSGREGNWRNFDIARERINFISSPNRRLHPEKSDAQILDFLVQEFQETIDRLGPDTVAVFLAEPLLASGGIIVPPKGYHAHIKAICEKYDILYVSDEVVTGFGRCGEWFASETVFGVVPDIITFAKGVTSGYVPLGGLAISERLIADVSGAKAKGHYFTNGYTYTGHPVACAAALASIGIIERENILAHVREIEPYFQNALSALGQLPFVADIRGKGLLGCVECQVDTASPIASDADRKFASRVDELCFQNGLIVRPIGNMCVLSPPLVIDRGQIDDMVAILRSGIIQAGQEYLSR